ncbi:MAG: MFS transporter [Mediterranea massiliensis]|nr:MFS transporter [Mediterranea massiliensis]
MKKNNTDKLFTTDFKRMCLTGSLLFASVYMFLPLLPMLWKGTFSIAPATGIHTWPLYAAFVGGMLLSGPFHAYLEDTYKRKHVMLISMLLLAISIGCFLIVQTFGQLTAIIALQGICWGIATSAGITLSIDITNSRLRTRANVAYSLFTRIGAFLGLLIGFLITKYYDFLTLLVISIVTILLGMFAISIIHVTFRAPIGFSLITLDRFLLPRAWLPAINNALKMFGVGALLPITVGGCYYGIPFIVLTFISLQTTLSSTRMFVSLSDHCQRGSANYTSLLAIESGLIAGVAIYHYSREIEWETATLLIISLVSALISLLLFLLGTFPYYKQMQRR